MNNELIQLVTVLGTTSDNNGFKTGEETVNTEIFAGIKSVGRTEYYEALRSGIEAKIIFLVDMDDFRLSERMIEVDGEQKKISATRIIYDGTTYLIGRTYRNNLGMLEITCREVE
jgi:hypothetical protein